MMRKALRLGIMIVLLSAATACSMESASSVPKPVETDENGVKIFSADKVARAPEKFSGQIGVKGAILKVNKDEKSFILSCGDACVRLPVKYDGELPKEKSKVVVYGKIVTAEGGGYVFNADKIKTK